MQANPQSSSASSSRWTVAAVVAAAIAIAGAALSWHGSAHAFGPGNYRHSGWEQVDPEAKGRRIEAMTSEQRATLAERRG